MLGVGDYIDLISYVDENSSPPSELPTDTLTSQQDTVASIEVARLPIDGNREKSELVSADIDINALRKGIF